MTDTSEASVLSRCSIDHEACVGESAGVLQSTLGCIPEPLQTFKAQIDGQEPAHTDPIQRGETSGL